VRSALVTAYLTQNTFTNQCKVGKNIPLKFLKVFPITPSGYKAVERVALLCVP